MKTLVILISTVSVALSAQYGIDKRQTKSYYPVQPTYAPDYEPTYTPGPVYRILRLENDVFPDGHYHYAYDTENGISAQEDGELKGSGDTAGTSAQGFYQYTSPEGIPIVVRYTADENGYQPTGTIIAGSTSKRSR